MEPKSYLVAFLLTLFGGVLTTGISYANGYSPCQIFGFCQSDLIEKNAKLLVEVDKLKAERDQLNLEINDRVTTLKQTLQEEKQLNDSILTIVGDIGKINKEGARTSETIRKISQKIRDIAHLLDSSDSK